MIGSRTRTVLSASALQRLLVVALVVIALWAAVLWAVATP